MTTATASPAAPAGSAAPPVLPVLGPGAPRETRRRERVTDVRGTPVAELCLAPGVMVTRAWSTMRAAAPPPRSWRGPALCRAAELFAEAELGGLSPERYEDLACAVSGLPRTTVAAARAALPERLRAAADAADLARPHGADAARTSPRAARGAVWTRSGDTLAVLAPGNNPGVHGLWPQALALGYRVAVRPSRREPFTASRLVLALRAAGWGPEQACVLPTDHDGAGVLLDGADHAVVYGGDDVVTRFAESTRVLAQGPGRSTVLLTADTDWRDHLDVIAASIAGRAGTGCVNATGVLVEGDPEPLAAALAERLARMPSLPPEHPDAVLPVRPVAEARALDGLLARAARGTRAHLGGSVVDDLGDGSAVLRPAVHEVAGPAPVGVELPFPCAWVGRWDRAEGLGRLRDSLVVGAFTGDEELVGSLLDEPGIANVYRAGHPTWTMRPDVPHDGFLGEFLMRSTGYLPAASDAAVA